jgi:hypothetical protein
VPFAADPFDPRFVGLDREMTPLGRMVQAWWYLRLHLIEACSDTVHELENHERSNAETH